VTFTRTRFVALAFAAAAIALAPATAWAQHARAASRVYVFDDATFMAASQTFKATVGQSRFSSLGGGADVGLTRHIFAHVTIESMSRNGSRAVIDNGKAFSLGIPLTVKLRPVDIGAGWQLTPHGRLGSHVGGGVSLQKYDETASFAQPGDDVHMTNHGFFVFGGVDVTIAKWLVAGGDAEYRSIPNAIGTGGISLAYGESNLGGGVVRGLVGVRF
jgi:hypothetical protein